MKIFLSGAAFDEADELVGFHVKLGVGNFLVPLLRDLNITLGHFSKLWHDHALDNVEDYLLSKVREVKNYECTEEEMKLLLDSLELGHYYTWVYFDDFCNGDEIEHVISLEKMSIPIVFGYWLMQFMPHKLTGSLDQWLFDHSEGLIEFTVDVEDREALNA